MTNVKSVAVGLNHSLALKADKTVWGWGSNSFGQLGDGTNTVRTTPVQTTGLASAAGISTSYYHCLAVRVDGTAWAWGINSAGQLGCNNTSNAWSPIQVDALSDAIGVATGNQHSIAVKADGTVWGWGGNNYGQLGPNKTDTIPEQLFEEVNTRTIHGYVWPLVPKELVPGFKQKHAVVVELRKSYQSSAVAGLSTTAVITAGTVGDFTIENVPYGDYVLVIKRPGYLTRCMNITISAWDLDIVELTPPNTDPMDNGVFRLWWGDCNGDLVIDSKDLSMIMAYWDLSVNDPGYIAACDLNADGRIDNDDLLLVIEYLGYAAWNYAGAEDVSFFSNPVVDLTVSQGGEYLIALSAWDMASFAGRTMTVTYDPAKLQLADAAAHVYGTYTSADAIPGTGITVTSVSSGSIMLTFNTTIPQGKTWSGVITVFKFKALAAGITTLSVQ